MCLKFARGFGYQEPHFPVAGMIPKRDGTAIRGHCHVQPYIDRGFWCCNASDQRKRGGQARNLCRHDYWNRCWMDGHYGSHADNSGGECCEWGESPTGSCVGFLGDHFRGESFPCDGRLVDFDC